MADFFTILNYQGSKRNLIEFIQQHSAEYIRPGKAILDIFSGSGAVGYSYKQGHTVFANDSEYYSSIISRALLGDRPAVPLQALEQRLQSGAQANFQALSLGRAPLLAKERALIAARDSDGLTNFYPTLPTLWNGQIPHGGTHPCWELFTTYYPASYFGLEQAMVIDSLRCAISGEPAALQDILLACLYYAMKECVFSKDGHMAQPLAPEKNKVKLLNRRERSVGHLFQKKLHEFYDPAFVAPAGQNRVYNLDFLELLALPEIQDQVGFIYADPPYTDMQYSRYYHLLNIVSKYNYPAPTKNGKNYTVGLYTEDRFQSDLSKKHACLPAFRRLIEFSKAYHKNLAVSFAYPRDTERQKTDRYVMSVEQIQDTAAEIYGAQAVQVVSRDYTHSNNRNSTAKKVLEYLILCRD